MAPKAKKARTDPMLQGVVDPIEHAEDLSEDCRKMLIVCAQGSLGVPSDERGIVQQEMVKMIGKAMDTFEAKLQGVVDAEREKLSGMEEAKSTFVSRCADADMALEAATKVLQEKKTLLDEAAKAESRAEETLAEKQEAQRAGNFALLQAEESKSKLEDAINIDFNVIVEGACDAEETKRHYRSLLTVLQGMHIDESLLSAMPSTCEKKPSERGTFDKMVIDQLEANLKAKLAELVKTLEDGRPATQERIAAVQAAQKEVMAAREVQAKAADEVARAEFCMEQASNDAKSAKAALDAFGPEWQKATAVRDKAAEKLQGFQQYNVECYRMLRDRLSKQAQATAEGSPAKPVTAGGA